MKHKTIDEAFSSPSFNIQYELKSRHTEMRLWLDCAAACAVGAFVYQYGISTVQELALPAATAGAIELIPALIIEAQSYRLKRKYDTWLTRRNHAQ